MEGLVLLEDEMAYRFDFETLIAYQMAVEVARWLRSARWPVGEAKLKDQAQRAADSAALNLAEGRMRSGRSRASHYEIALGSAGEVYAVLDLVDLPGAEDNRQKLRRLASALRGLL